MTTNEFLWVIAGLSHFFILQKMVFPEEKYFSENAIAGLIICMLAWPALGVVAALPVYNGRWGKNA